MVSDKRCSNRAIEGGNRGSIMTERIESLLLMACFGDEEAKSSAVRELSRRRLTEEMDGFIDFPAILSGFGCAGH